MKADYKLRKIIKAENQKYNTPEGYEQRIAKLLDGLPEKTKTKQRVHFTRNAIVYLFIILLSTTTVAAGAILVKLGSGRINTSKGTAPYQKIVRLSEIEKNNGKVNITKKDQGISFTVDHIGVDQGNIIVYYTIKTDQKMKLPGEEWETKRARLNYVMVPQITLNKKLLLNMEASNEVYQKNSFTVKGVFRQNISEDLKETLLLEINPETILDIKGDWSIKMTVDRSRVKDKSKRFLVKKDVVESAVLSPLGNVLEIKDGYKHRDMVLRDSKGNYLYTKVDSVNENQNSFLNFWTVDNDIDFLEVIPVKSDENVKGIKIVSLKLKEKSVVQISEHTKLKAEKIQKEKRLLRIYFKVLSYDGAVISSGPEDEYLTGKNLNCKHLNTDLWMDYEQKLLVLDFYDPSGGTDFRNAETINFLKQAIELDESKTETIDISK